MHVRAGSDSGSDSAEPALTAPDSPDSPDNRFGQRFGQRMDTL